MNRRKFAFTVLIGGVAVATGALGLEALEKHTLPSGLALVNSRRLIIYIKAAIEEIVEVQVGEPCDSITWKRVTASLEGLMESLKKRDFLYTYKVICDESMNTPTTIDRNELHGFVRFNRYHYAEFVEIEFCLKNEGTWLSDAKTDFLVA